MYIDRRPRVDSFSTNRTIAAKSPTTQNKVLGVMFMQYLAVAPKMQGLLDKLVYINTTILELPPAMQSAYTNLANAKTNLVRVKLGVCTTG